MAELLNVLKSSLLMLSERPKIFIPRLISAALTASILSFMVVSPSLSSILLVGLISIPLLIFLGSFTPVMTAAMVKMDGKENLLRRGLKETFENWRGLATLMAAGIVLLSFTTVIYMIGVLTVYYTGSIILLTGVVVLNLILILAAGVYLYFTPVAILDSQKTWDSFSKAFRTSSQNRKEVLMLMMFSFSLLIASSLATGYLRKAGLVLFFSGRLLSSVVGTYLLVISPTYYLSEEEQDES